MLASVDVELLDMYDEGEGEGEVDPVVDMMHRLSNRKMNIWFGSLIIKLREHFDTVLFEYLKYECQQNIVKNGKMYKVALIRVYIITFPHLSSNHQ